MNPDADYRLSVSGSSGNGKLRQWLIEQVDCGKYPGLVWENDDKSIFRIPWKHAGKQDYNRDEDAALFKAWALFKGKYREGIDKPDPPTWKTRLRCALNKSNDFEELVHRSQLDISDPYKVYCIIPEGAKKRPRQEQDGSPLSPMSYPVYSPYAGLQPQMPGHVTPAERGHWREYLPEQVSLPDLPFTQCPLPPRSLPWQGSAMDNGYQFTGSFYSFSVADQTSQFAPDGGVRTGETLSDLRLHVSVFYCESLVREVTTTSPSGCHITPCPSDEKPYSLPGAPELVLLPLDSLSAQRREGDRPPTPPATLERGVLVWMTPDGLYACRLCQEQVFWEGGPSAYGDKPNKLEREHTCKLLNTQDYLTELQSYHIHGRPLPRFQVLLSFGDECLDLRTPRRTLTVQVEPTFASQLRCYAGGHPFRGHDLQGFVESGACPPTEAFQRVIAAHHPSGSPQD